MKKIVSIGFAVFMGLALMVGGGVLLVGCGEFSNNNYDKIVNQASSYTLNFDANGGDVSPSSKTISYGSTYGALPTPTREGYTFNGWVLDLASIADFVDSTGIYYESGEFINEPNYWSHSNYIDFQNNSGSSVLIYTNYKITGIYAYRSDKSFICQCATNTTVFSIPSGTYFIRMDVLKEHLPFADRNKLTAFCFSKTISSNDIVRNSHNQTLYAQWINTLSFNPNGGSVSPSSKTITTGSTYGTLPTPTRAGYTFNGWVINLASVADFVNNKGIAYNTGVYADYENYWSHLNFIEFQNTSGFSVIINTNYEITGIYAYRSDKSFICQCEKNVTSYTIPNGTYFIRMDVHNGYLSFSERNKLIACCYSKTITSTSTFSMAHNHTVIAQWTPTSITNTVHLRVINKDGTYTDVDNNVGGRVEVTRNVIFGSTSSAQTRNQTENSFSYVCHMGNTFSIKGYANNGYAYVGTSTSKTPSESITNPANKPLGDVYATNSTTSENYYVYFKKLSANRLQYDETDKYFYFEDGYYPQTYANPQVCNALDTAISNGLKSSEQITYSTGSQKSTSQSESIKVYEYNGEKYALVKGKQKESPEWNGNGTNYYALDKKYKYTDAITINIWAYMENWADYGVSDENSMRIISCYENGGWGITTTNGNIRTSAYDSGVGYKDASSSVMYSSLGKNTWHMFSMTFDGSYWKSYLDGELIATSVRFSSGKIGYNPTNTIFVGAEASSSDTTAAGLNFRGKTKNLEIKNACVSSSELKELYNSGSYKMWFKFEPIRWRISDYGVEKTERNITKYKTLLKFKDYTAFSDNFVAVSDLILGVGAMHNTRTVYEGDSIEDMAGFVNIRNTTNDLSNETLKFNFNRRENIINIDSYSGYGNGQTNVINKNNSIAYSEALRVCSLAELNTVGFVNRGAKASDMVAFILGLDKDQVSYWTRDLSNLGAGVAITPTGTEIRPWLDEVLGMRFTYTFREGSNASF